MPTYEYWCNTHGHFETYKHVDEHKNPEECPVCNQLSEQVFSSVSMQPDSLWCGEYSAALGKYFTSKRQKEDYLKENNLAVVESGMDKDTKRYKKEAEEKHEKEIYKFVAKTAKDFDI